jgi:hypothetical protein
MLKSQCSTVIMITDQPRMTPKLTFPIWRREETSSVTVVSPFCRAVQASYQQLRAPQEQREYERSHEVTVVAQRRVRPERTQHGPSLAQNVRYVDAQL